MVGADREGCISNLLQSDARKYSYSSAPLYGLEGRKLTFGPINHFGLHPTANWKKFVYALLNTSESFRNKIRIPHC